MTYRIETKIKKKRQILFIILFETYLAQCAKDRKTDIHTGDHDYKITNGQSLWWHSFEFFLGTSLGFVTAFPCLVS